MATAKKAPAATKPAPASGGRRAAPPGQDGDEDEDSRGRVDRTITVPPHVDDELGAHWHEFKSTGAIEAREKLILHYAPLVKYVASRVATGLPASVEQADLVSYGMFGLIDALTKFEPGRGNKFETYAIPRIKGAIIDELRAMDWVPRSVRFKAREIEKAHTDLEAMLKRQPTREGDGRAAGDLAAGAARRRLADLVRLRPGARRAGVGRDGPRRAGVADRHARRQGRRPHARASSRRRRAGCSRPPSTRCPSARRSS